MPYVRNQQEITPSDFNVVELKIISDSAEVDVSYLLAEMNIHEDLFSKCISGNLMLIDSLNIISNLPLMESDLIYCHFSRNEADPYGAEFDPDFELEAWFEIVKIQNQEKLKQDYMTWTVSFVSSTWSDNLTRRVSKSYRQMPYSDIVKDIYDKYLSFGGLKGELLIKELETFPSEKLWNIVIPNWKPYNAIAWLAKRAFVGDAVNYLFYEDKEKFYFKPINELMALEPVETYFSASSDQYTQGTDKEPSLEILRARYLNILTMKFLEYHDIGTSAVGGMLGNRLIKHDIFNKRVTDYFLRGETAGNYQLDLPYDYLGDFAKLEHTDGGGVELIKPNTNIKFADEGGNPVLSVYPDHAYQWEDQPTYEPEKWLRQRRGQINQLQFVKFEITIPGNFTRRVGEKINLEIFSPEWKAKVGNEEPKLDPRFKGNYLITALRRKFTHDKHICVLEVIKDDYYSLETDPIWDEADSPVKFDGKGNVRGL